MSMTTFSVSNVEAGEIPGAVRVKGKVHFPVDNGDIFAAVDVTADGSGKLTGELKSLTSNSCMPARRQVALCSAVVGAIAGVGVDLEKAKRIKGRHITIGE
jgi:hypothetical protein